ncbi:uncharacterized protein BDV14DRAFT_175210 [Aspergillus stella-maris]|uniref:uncharacterized protein n=1 Tax=Aspergillus stella-maris TaxID=1810926 RepID=UPI003CCE35DB
MLRGASGKGEQNLSIAPCRLMSVRVSVKDGRETLRWTPVSRGSQTRCMQDV